MSEPNKISQFVVYTTEDNLSRLCSNKDNSWYQIIMKTKEVVISTKQGEFWDTNNQQLQVLHRAKVDIMLDNDFINQIKTAHPEKVVEDPCAAYLLDIDDAHAQSIQDKYGVICQSLNNPQNILIKRGGYFKTSDPNMEKSWKFIFARKQCPLNSLILVDRYFFSSEPGESIKDSFFNLRQILDAVLPPTSPDNLIQILIIFDYSTFSHGRDKKQDKSEYTFRSLAEEINKMKKGEPKLRDYAFTIELLSINSNCYKYDETHDRRIVANYNITEASHKLKAFREPLKSICNQTINSWRLFETGLDPEENSSTPAFTQSDIIGCIKDSVKTSKSTMLYACNGREFVGGNFDIRNRLLK